MELHATGPVTMEMDLQPLNKLRPSSDVKPQPITGPALQISQEHCYSKLVPFQSSSTPAIFPTDILFPSLASSKPEDSISSVKKHGRGSGCKRSYNQGQSDLSDTRDEEEEEEEEDENIDVVGTTSPIRLPYDELKVGIIMMECVKHINLVKVPPENSDLLLEKVLLECGFQQRRLLSTLLRILQGDHLARLTCKQVQSTASTSVNLRVLSKYYVMYDILINLYFFMASSTSNLRIRGWIYILCTVYVTYSAGNSNVILNHFVVRFRTSE